MKDRKILLACNRKRAWENVGGKIETFDYLDFGKECNYQFIDVIGAANRELREEIGRAVQDFKSFKLKRVYFDVERNTHFLIYECKGKCKHPITFTFEDDSIVTAKWFDVDDLPTLSFIQDSKFVNMLFETKC